MTETFIVLNFNWLLFIHYIYKKRQKINNVIFIIIFKLIDKKD